MESAVSVAHQKGFFGLGQVAENGFSDILLGIKNADDVILNLEGLADEDA